MPRSKGTFPKYSKIDIDPEVWPNRYYDASRLCESCEAHWPNIHLFTKCPNCDIATRVDETNAPDMRWPDAVSALLHGRFDKLYERYNEGRTDQELSYDDAKQASDVDFDSLDPDKEDSLTH